MATSEEVGCDKLNIHPFEIIHKKLNIPADKIWMIGDNGDNGDIDMVGAW